MNVSDDTVALLSDSVKAHNRDRSAVVHQLDQRMCGRIIRRNVYPYTLYVIPRSLANGTKSVRGAWQDVISNTRILNGLESYSRK